MAGDTDNPRIWQFADVYYAPVDSTEPTDIATAWAAAWKDIGLLAEGDITENRDAEVTDHYARGGILVRTTRSKHKRSFVVVALEDNDLVFKLANPGSTVTSATGITTRVVKVPEPAPYAFGFEMQDGTNAKRIIIPRGEVVTVGPGAYSDTAMRTTELTINVYPDADGVLYREVLNDPQAVPAA